MAKYKEKKREVRDGKTHVEVEVTKIYKVQFITNPTQAQVDSEIDKMLAKEPEIKMKTLAILQREMERIGSTNTI